MFMASINFRKGQVTHPQQEGVVYRTPSSVDTDEKFYVKVKGVGPQMPLLIYDKTREFEMSLEPGKPGCNEMREKVNAEPAFQGRKTYVMASFDAEGHCTVHTGMTALKKW